VKKEILVDFVERIPQGAVSRAWGWLARRRHPKAGVKLLKRAFVSATGINMAEADRDIGSFDTLQDLFIRHLKSGLRRVDPDPSAVVCPVDGTVGACGVVESDTVLQAKGRSYSVARLLGSAEQAKRFEGGAYATLYLSPKDYHRIHAPVSGQVCEATVIPGRLFPVFPEALARIDELFARNERLITYIDAVDAGRIAVVKVGATLVGRISAAYDDNLRTNVAGQQISTIHYDPPKLLQNGTEVGAFELGSTVVLFAEPDRVTFDALVSGKPVRMGQRMGTVLVRKVRSRRSAQGQGGTPSAPNKGQNSDR
jgi:phosphatidylserine decarboxylase